jgi:thiamine biosynthesis protein ThiI
MRQRILLRCPEITLKGRNQGDFRACLHRNVRRTLRAGGRDWPVRSARGRLYVEAGVATEVELAEVVESLTRVAGVESVSVGSWMPMREARTADGDLVREPLERAVVELAQRTFRPHASFALKINRVDKSLPLDSQALGTWLGDAIRRQSGWDRVELKSPDQPFFLNVYPDGLFLSAAKREGIGGLPVGSGGQVLSLLSGGIDSPVASLLLAKRGCVVDLFHMVAGPVPESLGATVVGRLAQRLSATTVCSRLWVAPYVYFDLALPEQRTGYELVLFRRFLMRTAERLAERVGALALVTGDSLGQVASQTLENLVSTSRAVRMPVLRPLVGMNKQEIIAIARRFGTYELSTLPHKDCCALLSAHPRTRSDHLELAALEHELLPDHEDLVERTLGDLTCLEIELGAVRRREEPAEPVESH